MLALENIDKPPGVINIKDSIGKTYSEQNTKIYNVKVSIDEENYIIDKNNFEVMRNSEKQVIMIEDVKETFNSVEIENITEQEAIKRLQNTNYEG
ncbi:hypothetical protein [Mesoplasma florum]|uniref:hypothetical protein n=1 Tax=Mesoplasma florum TaxID=2151 RepID=UPI000BE492E2|nr:hypothetical protein [Mesoplasma florum]ATI74138.1 hypothetical protein CQZ70_02685 [Mesoplasma florum]